MKLVKIGMSAIVGLGLLASTSAIAAEQTRAVAAIPNAKLVSAPSAGARTSARLTDSNELAGGVSIFIALFAAAAVILGIVVVATNNDDDPVSPG